MVKIFIAILIMLHGLAHIGGFLAVFTGKTEGFKNNPWIYSRIIYPKSNIGKIFGILWLLSLVFFVYSGIIVFLEKEWFSIPLFYGAILSTFVIVSWWKTVPIGAKIGVIFNILIISFLKVEILFQFLHSLL